MAKYYARQLPKIYNQGIYDESSTQQMPLGTKWVLADGRAFVYCKNAASGGPTGPGYLVQGPAPDSHQSTVSIAATAAIGDTTVYFTNGADTQDANTYKEGYIIFETSYGEGQCLKIKDHAAFTSGGTCSVNLYDALRVALTTASRATIVKHPCDSVINCPANTLTGVFIGVSPITPTASYYFWVQTDGPASVLVDNSTTLVVGSAVQPAGDVAGACQVAVETEIAPRIGVTLDVGAANQKATVILKSIAV